MESAIFLATKKRGEHGEILDDGEENLETSQGEGTRQALPTEEEDYDPSL